MSEELINKNSFPILEFDPDRQAMIEPSRLIKRKDVPEHCVLCFFSDVIEKVVRDHNVIEIADHRAEDGSHKIYELEYMGKRLAFFHPGLGAPLSAALFEEAIALGCRKFIACGGAGVLEKEMSVGKLVVVNAALRDEGVSYHYLPPARDVIAEPKTLAVISQIMQTKMLPFLQAKTWTTDAFYRETPGLVASRRDEGCVMVEMECAALMAVAQYRNVPFGQLLYSGDDLSGDAWSSRGWQKRSDIRESLFWLSAEACLSL